VARFYSARPLLLPKGVGIVIGGEMKDAKNVSSAREIDGFTSSGCANGANTNAGSVTITIDTTRTSPSTARRPLKCQRPLTSYNSTMGAYLLEWISILHLDLAKQEQDQNDGQNHSQSSARIIAPATAIRPRGHGSQEH